MASGEDKEKGKDHFNPEDPDKKSDQNGKEINQNNATGKKSKHDDNPFSFKKFLQASEGQNGGKGGCMKVVNPDLAKDLPDFVQGHSSHAECSRTQSNLPDFTFCTSINDASSIQSTPLPHASTTQPPSIEDCTNLSLPDFLSGSVGNPLLKNNSSDENEQNLQLQNSLLWQKIEQLKTAFLSEKQRNEVLYSQLSDQRRLDGISPLHQPTPPSSSTHSNPQDILPLNHNDSAQSTSDGGRECSRCVQMESQIRSASEQLYTIVQAANQFSRVLTEGSDNLNHISRMLSSSSRPDHQTVQRDN